MSIKGMISIIVIYFVGAGAWIFLGSVSEIRRMQFDHLATTGVESLWGREIHQSTPRFYVQVPGRKQLQEITAQSADISVDLQLEQKRKGLIWLPTYWLDFTASYSLKNTSPVAQNVRVGFYLPDANATYDELSFSLDAVEIQPEIHNRTQINHIVPLQSGAIKTLNIHYKMRGLRQWQYDLAAYTKQVRNLNLEVNTNFQAVDFVAGSLSPSTSELTESGMVLSWTANDLLTKKSVGVVMPEKLNPGPLSARMSFFAPVCLLFFFVLISALCIIKQIPIHPMHYLFVNASFFAFNLLFSYSVDHLDVNLSFIISALVSVSILTPYLRQALGKSYPLKTSVCGQLVYLVLFSYSFFLQGMTGLTVTIASILTLGVLMFLTAKTDWKSVFKSSKSNFANA